MNEFTMEDPALTQKMALVIATGNLHKIREFKEMLKGFSYFDLLSLSYFPDYTPVEETGKSFEEIAESKAVNAAKSIGQYVLADDSGLVVPALGGEPGIYSARYAGEGASDKDNRDKLIHALSKLRPEERIGYYHCSLALASPQGLIKTVSGTCEGEILLQGKGGNGFGYDPLFLKREYSKTFAELDEQTKNRISHRRKAFDKLTHEFELLISQAIENELPR